MWVIGTVEFLLYLTLATSLAVPISSPLGRKENKAPLAIGVVGVGAFVALSALLLYGTAVYGPLPFYGGLVVQDSFTSLMLLGMGLATALYLISIGAEGLEWTTSPSLYSLIPMTLFGAFFLAAANNLLVILASWLLVSIISYIVVGASNAKEAKAAAVRYVFVGVVATLMLVAALAMASIASGAYSLNLTALASAPAALRGLVALFVVLFLAALGFKVGLFPFHWWLPSVYGRGDGKTVSFVASVVKLSFLSILTRTFVVMSADSALSRYVALTLAILAVATMTYGNLAGLTTRDLQVILAYSSMAQVGYIFAAMAAAAYYAGSVASSASHYMLRLALYSVALQSLAYALAKSPLFAFVGDAGRDLSSLRGLMSPSPPAAVSASVLLYSLLGIPPLMGFWGKLYMFFAAAGYNVWLALLALINSGISSVYYIIASRDLLTRGEGPRPHARYVASLVVASILVLVLGIVAPLLFKAVVAIYA